MYYSIPRFGLLGISTNWKFIARWLRVGIPCRLTVVVPRPVIITGEKKSSSSSSSSSSVQQGMYPLVCIRDGKSGSDGQLTNCITRYHRDLHIVRERKGRRKPISSATPEVLATCIKVPTDSFCCSASLCSGLICCSVFVSVHT